MEQFEKLFGEVSPLLLFGMIAGLVELAKKFGLQGNWCIVLSASLGVLFSTGFLLIDLPQPVTYALIFRATVYGILFGLFVSGVYSLADRTGLVKHKPSE